MNQLRHVHLDTATAGAGGATTVVSEAALPMRAIVHRRYGTPGVLAFEEVDGPVPGDDEVLVRVHAAGASIGDHHIVTGASLTSLFTRQRLKMFIVSPSQTEDQIHEVVAVSDQDPLLPCLETEAAAKLDQKSLQLSLTLGHTQDARRRRVRHGSRSRREISALFRARS